MKTNFEDEKISRVIIQIAIPATLALLAKAIYNIVDTAYIGMLNSDTSLAAVGVTLPILLIMVSIENIFSSGAAVLAGRFLGAGKNDDANKIITSIFILSAFIGVALCVGGIIFLEPLMLSFGASASVLPEAKSYALWMFFAALANLPAQCMNSAARAESSARISSIAVITGAALNVVLDPVFMFKWGFDLGVEGASIATTISQFVTFFILCGFYFGGYSIIKIKAKFFAIDIKTLRSVISVGVPSAVIQICLSIAASAAKNLPDSDLITGAYGVVQRLVLIACYIVMGFMHGYQPAAAYTFGAGDVKRFRQSVKFALKGTLIISWLVSLLYIILSRNLIMLFNKNFIIINYGSKLLISQMIFFMAFGLCYMMTITFQTIGAARYGLFLSVIRQGIFYLIFIQTLPKIFGVNGIYFSQPLADIFTAIVCVKSFKKIKNPSPVKK